MLSKQCIAWYAAKSTIPHAVDPLPGYVERCSSILLSNRRVFQKQRSNRLEVKDSRPLLSVAEGTTLAFFPSSEKKKSVAHV